MDLDVDVAMVVMLQEPAMAVAAKAVPGSAMVAQAMAAVPVQEDLR